MEYQGWNAWADKYKPKKNHLSKYGEMMYETYGEEYDYIKTVDPRYVWTWVSGDMCDLLVAGVAYVNRLGYWTAEVPWENEEDYVLLSVEKECVCYSEDEEMLVKRDDNWGDPDCVECEGAGYVTEYVG